MRILHDLTIDIFGYRIDSLGQTSIKKVWVECERCGRVYSRIYRGIRKETTCRKCGPHLYEINDRYFNNPNYNIEQYIGHEIDAQEVKSFPLSPELIEETLRAYEQTS